VIIPRIAIAALSVFAFASLGAAQAATLTTPSFVVIVTENCKEDVACQDVSYVGTDRKSGETIRLKGRTLVAMCGDGVTPCHHIGYEFRNGEIRYFVSEDGLLEVSKQHKVLVHESGTWDSR